jgi:hypothetical protein
VSSALLTVFAASSPASTASASSATNGALRRARPARSSGVSLLGPPARLKSRASSSASGRCAGRRIASACRRPSCTDKRHRCDRTELYPGAERRGRPRPGPRRTPARRPPTGIAVRAADRSRRANGPPSLLCGAGRSRVTQRDVGPRAAKSPAVRGFSLCAREDSNFHGPIGPQGPQPRTQCVDASTSVQIVHIARFRGRIGRAGQGGCCHQCCHGK